MTSAVYACAGFRAPEGSPTEAGACGAAFSEASQLMRSVELAAGAAAAGLMAVIVTVGAVVSTVRACVAVPVLPATSETDTVTV